MRLQQIPIVMLITSTMLLASTNAQSSLVAQPTGRVRGTVMDLNEAVIPNAAIIIEGGKVKREVLSNEEGDYDVELPAGDYQIRAKVRGFVPLRRATFCVQPNTTTMINLVLLTLGSDVANPPIYYESFSVLPSHSARFSLLIQFMGRKKLKGFAEYHNVIASYDALTIYAAKMRFDSKTHQLEAEGNVIVEDGRQRVHVKRVEVKFKAGEPIIKLTPSRRASE